MLWNQGITRVLVALGIAAALVCASPVPEFVIAQEVNRPANTQQNNCMSWSEARTTGMMKKFTMRDASDIKSRAEAQYGGKVVSFQICERADGLIYRLAVFRPDGNVVFVTEPAQ